MNNDRYNNFCDMLISIAEYIKNYCHMPDFNMMPADHSRGGSFGSTSFGYSAWYKLNNEKIATYWEIDIIDTDTNFIKKFLYNKNTAEIIEWIKADPQKFLDELTIFMIHEL